MSRRRLQPSNGKPFAGFRAVVREKLVASRIFAFRAALREREQKRKRKMKRKSKAKRKRKRNQKRENKKETESERFTRTLRLIIPTPQ